MEKSKIIIYSLVHSVAIVAYIALVAYIMQTSDTIFAGLDGFMAIVPVLLLLVFSVAIMAVLVFGRPVYLFINGHKRAAVEFLIHTLGWLFAILVAFFVLMSQTSITNLPSTELVNPPPAVQSTIP